MKEIRCSFAVIVLLVILAALMLSGAGSSLAINATPGLHTHIFSRTGIFTGWGNAPCPDGGPDDC